jgi:hypothetical protein
VIEENLERVCAVGREGVNHRYAAASSEWRALDMVRSAMPCAARCRLLKERSRSGCRRPAN